MQNNFYDDNSKYKNVIDLLKSLPKVEAPQNFEFDLMTKIQNEAFNLNTKEDNGSRYFWLIIPTTGVILSAIVLYFVFFNDNFQQVNPFMKEPPRISSLENNTDYPKLENDVVLDQKPLQANLSKNINKNKKENIAESNKAVRVLVKPNDVLTEEIVELPFDKSKSVDLDMVLNNNRTQNTMTRGTLVGGTNRNRFNGFYIQDPLDQKYLQYWKAKLDSIYKLRQKSARGN